MLRVYYTRIDPLYDDLFFKSKLSRVSEERRRKVLSYKNQADRCRSLAVGLLFMYGCRQVGFSQEVFPDENGKPQLTQPNAYFNLSHAGNYAAAVFSDHPAGIDVECAGRFSGKEHQADRMQRIARKIFTTQELEDWETIPFGDAYARESALIRIWTRKEAFAKMRGKGLAMDFASIDSYNEEYFLSWKLGDLCWVSISCLHSASKNDTIQIGG